MLKVLVVEDSHQDRYMLESLLKGYGYEVVSAENGLEALRISRAAPPDIVISDIMMPVMDGFSLCREWKTDEKLKDIPFLFYTATYTTSRDEELAQSLGADRFLVKPLEPEILIKKVQEVIEKARLTKGVESSIPSLGTEMEFFRQYNEVLFYKLEKKVDELNQEIAERKQTEAILRRSEAFNRNILESISEGLIVIDRDYRIISANRAYCQGKHKPLEGIIGKHCYHCSQDIDRHCNENGEECPARRTFEDRLAHSAFHVFRNREGNTTYLEIRSYPMETDGGPVNAVIEIVNDITERKRLEEQLQHTQKMDSIGQLAGSVAHDFNNILSAIIGFASLIQMHASEEGPIKTNIDQILNASQRAAVLTQGLLAVSRKQAVHLVRTDLNDIVENFERFLIRILREDIELIVQHSEKTLPLMADIHQIEHVLMNLASNARDAMPHGGKLTVQLERIGLSKEFAESYGYGTPGVYALLSFADTGMGMTEEIRKKIFEPFFSTKEEGKGTGLGLSIVYGIVKSHNGFINVHSKPGYGTTFKIYLPLDESPVYARETMEEEPAVVRGGTETILIAEDDPGLRKLASIVLSHYGYTVIESSDGEDAVQKFKENKDRIRLILLDGIMPKKSGIEALEEIRNLNGDIKVILMSGYSETDFSTKKLLEQRVSYINKPFTPSDLGRMVREVLDKA
jgi:two-component system, cell cycle sensor histidine kinase and response regulator CckA